MARMFKSGNVVTMASTGIAAVNIDGSTLHSTLGINFKGDATKLSDNRLVQMREKLQIKTHSLVIIDEVSNISAKLMGIIDSRFRDVTGKDLPFGGVSILFFGDLSQLPPVKNISIARNSLELAASEASQVTATKDRTDSGEDEQEPVPKRRKIINVPSKEKFRANQKDLKKKIEKSIDENRITQFGVYKAGSLHRAGAQVFSSLERYHLVDQKRIDDAEHLAFLTKMSKGVNISDGDLAKYRKLSRNDMAEGWKFAPVLVSSNKERVNICYAKAKLFALDRGEHVFRWRAKAEAPEVRSRRSSSSSMGRAP
jgi:hypothetical protein